MVPGGSKFHLEPGTIRGPSKNKKCEGSSLWGHAPSPGMTFLPLLLWGNMDLPPLVVGSPPIHPHLSLVVFPMPPNTSVPWSEAPLSHWYPTCEDLLDLLQGLTPLGP